ncbi:leucine-rich repeat-containing protein 56 [Antennarius striatus]|uniref:leucine-rich repeat-containing protein 56 n=1 Tax=Antennarius striatus TaxID=241820 RepID=UPI0035B1670B
MSSRYAAGPPEVRPGTARVSVTELSASGHINPTPTSNPSDDPPTAVDLSYLSPDRLKLLCGTRELSHVTSLDIQVDTEENTLGNFGNYLPRLVQLRMNNSVIVSVRDLGTTLSHLQVLWMPRCALQDLDGIATFCSLKELYVAYNSVSDLSQVGMLENLQLLDLEGNNVDDLVQVQYLGLCGKLQTLTLEGNPVCACPNPTVTQVADYNYRAAVRELVPQLCFLDNLRVDEDGFSFSSAMREDLDILCNSIRDCSSGQAAPEYVETADGACLFGRPASAGHPAFSRSCIRPQSLAGSRPKIDSRPMSATVLGGLSRPGSRPSSAESDLAMVETETSILTHGAGKILFCGNPVKGVRARREKLRTAPPRSTFIPRDFPIHVPEHTYDLEEPVGRERADVFAELKAWREQHSNRLQAIETERSSQILAIKYSDEEEEDGDDNDDDDEEEEGIVCAETDSSAEESGEEKHVDCLDTLSPDSSFQSISPDLQHGDISTPDVTRLTLSPGTMLSPSPPPSVTAAPENRKSLGMLRARRFRLSQTFSECLPDIKKEARSSVRDTNLKPQEAQFLTRTDAPRLPLTPHMPYPSTTNTLGKGLVESCVKMGLSGVHHGDKDLQTPQMSRVLARPAITRPHTARAALQRHHSHQLPPPCGGRSHPL